MMEGVRALGLAARFVTGYLYDPMSDGDDASPAYPHAWIEVYLPGAGWCNSIRPMASSGPSV